MKNYHYNLKISIGDRLKKARKTINITQRELAIMLNMDPSSITGIEKGKAFPSIPIMLFLMEKYHISPLWLMGERGEMLLNESNLNDEPFKKSIMGEVIETVDELFKKNKLFLPSNKKVELIFLIYEEILEDESRKEVIKKKIPRIIKLIS